MHCSTKWSVAELGSRTTYLVNSAKYATKMVALGEEEIYLRCLTLVFQAELS